jgi:hypothetical protein
MRGPFSWGLLWAVATGALEGSWEVEENGRVCRYDPISNRTGSNALSMCNACCRITGEGEIGYGQINMDDMYCDAASPTKCTPKKYLNSGDRRLWATVSVGFLVCCCQTSGCPQPDKTFQICHVGEKESRSRQFDADLSFCEDGGYMEQQALFVWSTIFVIFFFCLFTAIANCCRRQAREMYASQRQSPGPTDFTDLQRHLSRPTRFTAPGQDDEILATALALSILQQRREQQQVAAAIIVQAVPVAVPTSEEDNSQLPVAVPVVETAPPTSIAHRISGPPMPVAVAVATLSPCP